MVSLANDSFGAANGGSRGAFFFDDLAVEQDDAPTSHPVQETRAPSGPHGSINGEDDDVMLIPPTDFRSPSENSGGNPDFVRLKTPLILLFESVLFIAMEVAVFLLPHLFQSKSITVPESDDSLPYYILLYAQAALWVLIFCVDRCMWLEHRKIQTRGYLDFHRTNKTVRQTPLILVSVANSALLLMSTLIQQFPIESTQSIESSQSFSAFAAHFYDAFHAIDKNNVLQILVTAEVFSALLAIVILLVRTIRFNTEALPPDVQQEDALMQSGIPALRGTSARDIGFRDASLVTIQEGDNVSSRELIEKQADQIRYLKSQCANLSRKCLKFQAQLQSLRDQ